MQLNESIAEAIDSFNRLFSIHNCLTGRRRAWPVHPEASPLLPPAMWSYPAYPAKPALHANPKSYNLHDSFQAMASFPDYTGRFLCLRSLFIPPWISLVNESPTIMTFERSPGQISEKTFSKKPARFKRDGWFLWHDMRIPFAYSERRVISCSGNMRYLLPMWPSL